MSASEALQAAAVAALRQALAIGVYDGAPVQAAYPYAVVEPGPESDWGHKSGAGRELRIAVTVRDQGERPGRVGQLASEVQAALGALGPSLDDWQLVTMAFARSRIVQEARAPIGSGPAWAAVVEYRARMLAGTG